MTPVLLLGAAVTAAGIFMAVRGLTHSPLAEDDVLSSRLRVYDGARQLTYTEIELGTKSFYERIIQPIMASAGGFIASRISANQRDALQSKMDFAGRAGELSPEVFLAGRIGAAILLFVVGLLLGLLAGNPVLEMFGSVFGAGFGYVLPTLWLNQKVGNRRKQIQRSLPETIDLLTISVEAGLAFDNALVRVIEKFKNVLSDELNQVITEAQLGRPRLEALDAMGRRCGVPDLHNFVQAVIQSEQMGVGITRILRLQSEEMRRKRRQRAQEKAAQATLKMLLPMVGCIFPTLWIILLGPAILILMKARGGG